MFSRITKLFVFSVFLFLSAFTIEAVYAQEIKGIIVTPKRVVFGPGERVKELLVANRGNVSAKYRISLINRAMNEQGRLVPTDKPAANEFFADKFVRFAPRQVTLGPKETQTVRVMSRISNNAKPGEYRSHILVQEIPEAAAAESAGTGEEGQLGINVRAIFGLSLPVIIRKGDLTYGAKLVEPKIESRDDATFLDVKIEREGNKSVFGTLKVFADGREIGILKNVSVYLSTPTRLASIKLNPDFANDLSGKTIRVTYSAVESNEDAPSVETTFTAP